MQKSKGGKKRKESVDDGDGDGEKKLQNQFSFVERATQTMNNAMKVGPLLKGGYSASGNYISGIFFFEFLPKHLYAKKRVIVQLV